LQDNGTWLTTLQRGRIVELITDGVTEITADGVRTIDGVHRPADVLVWATGFDVKPSTRTHQRSRTRRGGTQYGVERFRVRLSGRHRAGLPEFLLHVRPGHQPRCNGASIIYNSECQMRYIMGCIDMVLAGGFGSATVRADVVR